MPPRRHIAIVMKESEDLVYILEVVLYIAKAREVLLLSARYRGRRLNDRISGRRRCVVHSYILFIHHIEVCRLASDTRNVIDVIVVSEQVELLGCIINEVA